MTWLWNSSIFMILDQSSILPQSPLNLSLSHWRRSKVWTASTIAWILYTHTHTCQCVKWVPRQVQHIDEPKLQCIQLYTVPRHKDHPCGNMKIYTWIWQFLLTLFNLQQPWPSTFLWFRFKMQEGSKIWTTP